MRRIVRSSRLLPKMKGQSAAGNDRAQYAVKRCLRRNEIVHSRLFVSSQLFAPQISKTTTAIRAIVAAASATHRIPGYGGKVASHRGS
jgi:hypothetical protein